MIKKMEHGDLSSVATSRVRILDRDMCRKLIRRRQEQEIDQHDEIWEGVYVVPPLANNPHHVLVGRFCSVLDEVIVLEERGEVMPGANVSDRRHDWEKNYRCPDVVVVLKDSKAIDCGTHFFGGPGFLVEIQSPGDETVLKIPFYAKVRVRELLVVQRDTRRVTLYRHNGRDLVPATPTEFQGGKWLVSAVVPLAFRRLALKSGPRVQLRRTDAKPGRWAF